MRAFVLTEGKRRSAFVLSCFRSKLEALIRSRRKAKMHVIVLAARTGAPALARLCRHSGRGPSANGPRDPSVDADPPTSDGMFVRLTPSLARAIPAKVGYAIPGVATHPARRGSKAGYTRRRVDAPRLDDGTVIFS